MGGSQVLTPSLVAGQEDLGPFGGHPVPWLPGTFIKVTLHTRGLTDVPKADLISGRAHLGTFTHRVVSPSILFTELGREIPGRSTLCSGPNSFGNHRNDMVSGFCLMGIGAGGAMECVLRGLDVWGLPEEQLIPTAKCSVGSERVA